MFDQEKWVMLGKAIEIATNQHSDQYDKGGKPYILHCLHVMNNVGDDPERMTAAVLHDLIEDTSWELSDLKLAGFSDHIVYVVDLLTHQRGMSREEYIERITEDMDAMVIKIADLKHNMDLSRLPVVGQKDIERRKQYEKDLVKLQAAVNQVEELVRHYFPSIQAEQDRLFELINTK